PRCVERLRGMFAFAIWDKRRKCLLLARDRLGIKPLYYHQGPGGFAFASEIRALLASGTISSRLNRQALHDYLTFQHTVAPQTMFEGIQKLEPGHLLVVAGHDVTKERYWSLDYSPKFTHSPEACIDEFYEQFKAVTRSHLVGEVPLGVMLSGGLDSTAVTAVVAELIGHVKTFSVAFATGGEDYDERRYARLVARHVGTDHHEIELSQEDFARGLREYIWSMEEPMADPSSVPLYYVAGLAGEHVRIVLSGEGADELLGGYFRASDFTGLARARWFRRIPRFVRRGLLQPLNDGLVRSARIRRHLDLADRPFRDYFQVVPAYMGVNVFSHDAKQELYGPRMRADGFRPPEALVVDAYRRAAGLEFADQLLAVYTEQWLPDNMLLKADKMTMAHSLELRVPFLDHTFVEFVARLPVQLKMRMNGHRSLLTKYALRRAFAGKIPPEIIERPKRGFPVPLQQLVRHDLRPMALDLFGSRVVRESGLFDPHKLRGLFDRPAVDGHDYRIWRLLVFCTWLDLFKVAS
ncbi:MAG TPA: asparagine synthase (glutamine-hydrolyzing), partial [bacterium]|nr:asparagine synthase (glutamine-hydrolyzing) [bacterium]